MSSPFLLDTMNIQQDNPRMAMQSVDPDECSHTDKLRIAAYELIKRFSINLSAGEIPEKLREMGYSFGSHQLRSVIRHYHSQKLRFVDRHTLMNSKLSSKKKCFRAEVHTHINELIEQMAQLLNVPHDRVLDTVLTMISERSASGELNLLYELEIASDYGFAQIKGLIGNLEKLNGRSPDSM